MFAKFKKLVSGNNKKPGLYKNSALGAKDFGLVEVFPSIQCTLVLVLISCYQQLFDSYGSSKDARVVAFDPVQRLCATVSSSGVIKMYP